MRNSRNLVIGLSLGFLVAVVFGTAGYAQDVATVPAQPSMELASNAASPGVGAPTQPSDDAVAASDSSQPSVGSATLSSPQSTTKASPSGTASASSVDETSDKKWHYSGTVYLWIPQINGTVGVRGYDTNIHVSSGDIFSNFRGGFLGVFTPSYNRFSAPVDVIWMRLRDSKPVPYVPVENIPPYDPNTDYSVRATLNMTIVTPKVNYLALNTPKLKIYGTAGARVWHVGTTLSLVPVVNGTFPYKGVTWTDYVMGARFSAPLGKKASVDILGDGGEGGATLDYQLAGILSYQAKPNIALQAGWRYLVAHYGNNGDIFNGRVQGLLIGATFKIK